ncbi:MAG: GtrA family protein [Terriglobales bacterium]
MSEDAGGLSTESDASPVPPFQKTQSQKDSARQNLFRWLKFNFVGGVGIFVQLGALALFRSELHLNYLLATALAVETAVIHNFLWHERFTWKDRPSAHRLQSLARFAKFNATNGAVSIAGNLLIMRALVGQFHMNYLIANLIAVTVCSLLNFLLSDWVVFEREKPAP